MNIFIVIPSFNEDKTIETVLEEVKEANLPIIVVDDGSKDATYNKAKKMNTIILRHKVNLGKGAALKTGCEVAFSMGADAIIMMDSDSQHKAQDLPKFIEKIQSGKYDIVFGSRNMNLGVPLVRFIGNKIASFLVSMLFGIYISDLVCGYRALTKKAYLKMSLESSNYGIETEIVIKAGELGLRYCEIPVETIYYDKFKGVTILDALAIFGSVLKWRLFK